ncbi:Ribosomal protein L34 [Spraguea lophii 42_110]|uniref:Ribosomal protein L34 n=1 Tax=Spraguea lophii (strain 42_110) TaxID=1358809 RepID=S7W7C6_SPRLO|nr:Chain LGG, Ribosomal protein L34 [Spraguea lophii 42_110]7QJH_KGG Chain KGG, Ribosomal protein L34 [Spraguea lophii 42_110]7QJH_LGG Chain LGG, Ribosomal protein L34 [Spraguea lophii 42_110]8BR3_LGG Chain LGG, Ribosomal protein L34 [Spraguea lophii 42_110]8P5D_LGG Chain LGG, Ribosomal protein L34 [Spraguea lophii 42_110]8P60_KGG Chain KGG, Ribosomal protein L34 [Spraguea lophii 42_110]8P60_LGG Chain LGG, Ribosomal protein L34 [Spraguea lophii 42_110]EPR78730.1 Ribosomal protein L34 [Spragu
MVERQVVRRGSTFNTRSNKRKKVRTPGNRLVFQDVKKKGKGPKCGQCGIKLAGVKEARPAAFSRMRKSCRKVNRILGGVQCAKCVQEKVLDAFLNAEEKRMKELEV